MPALEAFISDWRLNRVIEDARAGHRARFTGRARFSPDGAGLRYAESGQLRLPDQPPLTATRDYLWRPGEDGIAVLFADGRPFHVIHPGNAPCAEHTCDPDSYQVSYDFGCWPEWRTIWCAVGPGKDYVMHSQYLRAGD